MLHQFKNFASSVISNGGVGVLVGDTIINLLAGGGAKFPALTAGQYFFITAYQKSGLFEINHEIMKVTARAGDALTVVRAQDGTVAQVFADGDPVELRFVSASMDAERAEMDAKIAAGTAQSALTGATQGIGNNSASLATTAYVDGGASASTQYIEFGGGVFSETSSPSEVTNMLIKQGGTYRVQITLNAQVNYTAYAQIYKNGVAYGAQRSAYYGSGTFTEDLLFAPNDTMQILAWSSLGSTYPSTIVSAKIGANCRVSPTYIGLGVR